MINAPRNPACRDRLSSARDAMPAQRMPGGLIDRGAERRLSELLRQQHFPLFVPRSVRSCFEHDGRGDFRWSDVLN